MSYGRIHLIWQLKNVTLTKEYIPGMHTEFLSGGWGNNYTFKLKLDAIGHLLNFSLNFKFFFLHIEDSLVLVQCRALFFTLFSWFS